MKIPIFPGKYHQNGGFSMAMLVYRSVLHVLFRSLELGFKLLERWTCFVGTIWDGTRGLWCSAGFWREDHSWQLELQSNQVWGMCPRKNPSTSKKNEKVKRLMNVSALGKLFALSILCLVFLSKRSSENCLDKTFLTKVPYHWQFEMEMVRWVAHLLGHVTYKMI